MKSGRVALFCHANYNWFIVGSLLSHVGDWFERLALSWLIFTLTNSALYISLIEVCRFAPILAFSLPAGVAADRWDRRRVLIITQVGAMLFTFAIAFVTLQGVPRMPLLAVLILLRGIFLAFEIPARQALIPNLVPPQEMGSAIALFTVSRSVSRIGGAAAAGLLLKYWEPPTLIAINAASFVAVIGTLVMIRPVSEQVRAISALSLIEGAREAGWYLKAHPLVMGVFVLGIAPLIFGFPYIAMMPVFAGELLQVGPEGFGMLLSVSAVGGAVGPLLMTWVNDPLARGLKFFLSICSFGLGLILFAFSRLYTLSLVIMFLVGLTSQGYRVLGRVIIQEMVPDRFRGRILSIVMMDAGLSPLGGVVVAYLAQTLGSTVALCAMGSVCIGTAVAVVAKNRRILSIQ